MGDNVSSKSFHCAFHIYILILDLLESLWCLKINISKRYIQHYKQYICEHFSRSSAVWCFSRSAETEREKIKKKTLCGQCQIKYINWSNFLNFYCLEFLMIFFSVFGSLPMSLDQLEDMHIFQILASEYNKVQNNHNIK